MTRWIATALLLCAVFVAARADEAEPPADKDLGLNIVAAAAFDGSLWVLGAPRDDHHAGGALVSFNLVDGARQLRIAANVIGLQKIGNRLVALVAESRDRYSLKEWKAGAFVALPTLPLKRGNRPEIVLPVGNAIGVLATHRLYILHDTAWQSLPIDDNKPPPPDAFPIESLGPFTEAAGITPSGHSIYFGTNQGEWGGSLGRRDLVANKSSAIENRDKAPDGRAIYDSGLDPINAIIGDPVNPDCVIAAVGLIHFEASGRLLRVCGDTASIALNKLESSKNDSDQIVYNSEAFFGLVAAKDGYWAVSNAAVYRVSNSGESQRYILSQFDHWHGLYVSREAPGALVLLTEVNRRFSVNNGTPLIVPLD